jgi:hypothetical protein
MKAGRRGRRAKREERRIVPDEELGPQGCGKGGKGRRSGTGKTSLT